MNFVYISIILLFSTRSYLYLAKKFKIFDVPNHRSSHSLNTIRGVGVIIPISFFSYLFFFDEGTNFTFFSIGLFIISLISALDDIFSIKIYIRLIVHFISSVLLLIQLGHITVPPVLIMIAVILIVGWLNAFNFMDGVNGMAALYAATFLLSLLFIPELDNKNSLILSLLLALAIFIFLNVREKPISFFGDSGSITMPYLMAFLMFLLIQKTGS
ncbi:UDP-GlcNAc--UDP-phosphate GlcNAc-1-phosphate transferase, partial [Candidatus Marinimicrobia bacterium]|nr:UDP-GlcNAc--UDP-phosphate GlcNAc-1-phosphate transferase [Candidatus Neomarinimicrobiota bacterium]